MCMIFPHLPQVGRSRTRGFAKAWEKGLGRLEHEFYIYILIDIALHACTVQNVSGMRDKMP